jgi:hypothetical protein
MVRLGLLLALAGVLIASTLLIAPASATDKYPQLSPITVEAECMPCQAKCRKCIWTGRFATVQECYADCNSRGNPPVVSQCGIFKRC